MRLEALRRAVKTVEDNLTIDYSGMSPEEIEDLDRSVDVILKLCRLAIINGERR